MKKHKKLTVYLKFLPSIIANKYDPKNYFYNKYEQFFTQTMY